MSPAKGLVVGKDASERIGSGVNSAQTGSGIATRGGEERGSEMASHGTNEDWQMQEHE